MDKTMAIMSIAKQVFKEFAMKWMTNIWIALLNIFGSTQNALENIISQVFANNQRIYFLIISTYTIIQPAIFPQAI